MINIGNTRRNSRERSRGKKNRRKTKERGETKQTRRERSARIKMLSWISQDRENSFVVDSGVLRHGKRSQRCEDFPLCYEISCLIWFSVLFRRFRGLSRSWRTRMQLEESLNPISRRRFTSTLTQTRNPEIIIRKWNSDCFKMRSLLHKSNKYFEIIIKKIYDRRLLFSREMSPSRFTINLHMPELVIVTMTQFTNRPPRQTMWRQEFL